MTFVHAFAIHGIVLYVEFYVLFHIARKVRNGGNEVTDRVSWLIGWLASIGFMSPISSHFLAVQVIVQQEWKLASDAQITYGVCFTITWLHPNRFQMNYLHRCRMINGLVWTLMFQHFQVGWSVSEKSMPNNYQTTVLPSIFPICLPPSNDNLEEYFWKISSDGNLFTLIHNFMEQSNCPDIQTTRFWIEQWHMNIQVNS